ncbi:MAG: alcohol dehydrogenase catalytic domain-containing protein [Planctomycetota bacterium]
MRAMLLPRLVSLGGNEAPLEARDVPAPTPGPRDVLIRVSVCGVCHTELDEVEGRTPPPKLPVVLGHQVVGRVAERGLESRRFEIGDRVGVGWIHSSSGETDENTSPCFQATGRDVHGGYAEFMTVPEEYAYPIPAAFTDEEAAPLLCAGAVGYRALKLCTLGEAPRLGLTGFGASAHLVLPLARHLDPATCCYVFARNAEQRELARHLGADWVGDTADRAPEKLDAVIDTTPAWRPVVEALANLRPGGRLVINAIRKTDSDKASLLELDYEEHLWMEKEIKTVANITRSDIADFLTLAAAAGLRPQVKSFPLGEAKRAVQIIKQGGLRGAIVLKIGDG